MLILKNFKCFKHSKANLLQLLVRSFSEQASKQPLKQSEINAVLLAEPYGQPTYETHPHLVNEDELVPGVKLEEFKDRRYRLMHAIQKYAQDNLKTNEKSLRSHMVIVPSANKKFMSDHIPYIFRQNSDFYYLTGCLEQETVLMMTINEKSDIKSTLFIRPKSRHAELWDGPRTGIERAVDFFGVEEAYSPDVFNSIVQRQMQTMRPQVWFENRMEEQPKIKESVENIVKTNDACLYSPTTFIESLRLFKSLAEQDLMRKTCQIASKAINIVMKDTKPGLSEHHLFAMVDYYARMNNASHLAYPPVVASGRNTTTIHYINNSQIIKSGDLILLDAGCEYGGYSSDITRTWPVSGTFTQPQRDLYEVVSTLHNDLICLLLKEGADTLDHLFETMCVKLGKYFQEIGIVDKSITHSDALFNAGFKFCPHHVSHYLGMDVHDTPLIPRSLKLVPGMVFTVEPGVYISHDNMEVPKEFRGLGIRIEDDILITPDRQVEILTQSCLKNIDELENLSKQKI